jgi:transcriptional regulator with PAS, ATPase and Fis domain
VKSQKIDQFVTKLVKKISLDDLLPLTGHIREYIVINLFGEVQGKWSRLDLFAACEADGKGRNLEGDIAKQKEEQVLEWMIYLILEHIPRPLFAMNQKGKTIFYNSHFEDLFTKELGADTDIKFIEDSLGNPDRNEFFFRKKGSKEVYFYNKDLKFYYEKVQLVSGEKPVGFLVYGDRSLGERDNLPFPGVNVQGLPLNDIIASTERTLIVNALKEKNNNLKEAARDLKITLPALQARIKKHRIKTGPPAEKKKKPERGGRKGRIKK